MTRHSARFSVVLIQSLLILAPLAAQNASTMPADISVDQLLNDALLFRAGLSVVDPGSGDDLWDTDVVKITIPGRSVTVSLEGGDARLKVAFTLYPSNGDELLLVARSDTWVNGDYNSTLTSFPVAFHDEVYYYPLGRAEVVSEDTPVEIQVRITVIPYLETLNAESRAALESVLDSSARFRLTEDTD